MNKKQKANLIGAGTVTALLLMLGLAFGNVGAKDTAVTEPASNRITIQDQTNPSVEQLQQELQAMQNREAEYAAQIRQANELLAEQAKQTTYTEHEEDEAHEHEEHGSEGQEYEDD